MSIFARDTKKTKRKKPYAQLEWKRADERRNRFYKLSETDWRKDACGASLGKCSNSKGSQGYCPKEIAQ